jgi:cell division protein FtsN
MSRDYKSRAHPARPKQKPQKPGWVWFVAGLLVGVFISGLVWLKVTPSSPALPRQAAPAKPPKKPAQAAKKPQQEAPKPRFDFYTILPEMEVVVPDPDSDLEPVARPATTAAPERPAKAVNDGVAGYMLQMGSFRKLADADRLKASLALVGIQAEIQRVNIKGGDVYHRVRSGPYDRVQVNRLRNKLKQNKISSLVIKYRK